MPTIEGDGVRLYYEMSGRAGAPLLMLLNSLGSSMHMWDKVLPALEAHFHLLRFDMRGHGQSEVSVRAFTIEQLGRDALMLMNELGAQKVCVCGVSLGGLVGLWLGIHAPERVNGLILANTAARIGSGEMWQQRIDDVKANGMEALAIATLKRWFTPTYREKHSEEMERLRAMIAATHPDGYAACCRVLRDTDLRAEAPAVHAATLVMTGTHDPATPPSDGRALHTLIPGARYVELNGSHLSAWECADAFASAVVEHLTALEVAHG